MPIRFEKKPRLVETAKCVQHQLISILIASAAFGRWICRQSIKTSTPYPCSSGIESLATMTKYSEKDSASKVEDLVKLVQRDPGYGYGGRLQSIRKREYGYLRPGGID